MKTIKLKKDIRLTEKETEIIQSLEGCVFLRVAASRYSRTTFRFFALRDGNIYTCHEDEYSVDIDWESTKIIFTDVYACEDIDVAFSSEEYRTPGGVASYNDLEKILEWRRG